LTAEYTDQVGVLCRKYNLKLHVDGARLMNASVALNVPAARLVEAADSVSLCLSKGLAAPVGSVIVGTVEFITAARRFRKCLGGGMRQVGILAAAGLVSIHKMVQRLKDDHHNAKLLASGINKISGLKVDEKKVDTNILFVEVVPDRVSVDANQICVLLKSRGILTVPTGQHLIRFVTHYQITTDSINQTLKELESICATNRIST